MANTSPQVAEKYLEYYVKSKLRPGLFMFDDLAESINITVFQGYTSNILEKIIENNTVSGEKLLFQIKLLLSYCDLPDWATSSKSVTEYLYSYCVVYCITQIYIALDNCNDSFNFVKGTESEDSVYPDIAFTYDYDQNKTITIESSSVHTKKRNTNNIYIDNSTFDIVTLPNDIELQSTFFSYARLVKKLTFSRSKNKKTQDKVIPSICECLLSDKYKTWKKQSSNYPFWSWFNNCFNTLTANNPPLSPLCLKTILQDGIQKYSVDSGISFMSFKNYDECFLPFITQYNELFNTAKDLRTEINEDKYS